MFLSSAPATSDGINATFLAVARRPSDVQPGGSSYHTSPPSQRATCEGVCGVGLKLPISELDTAKDAHSGSGRCSFTWYLIHIQAPGGVPR